VPQGHDQIPTQLLFFFSFSDLQQLQVSQKADLRQWFRRNSGFFKRRKLFLPQFLKKKIISPAVWSRPCCARMLG